MTQNYSITKKSHAFVTYKLLGTENCYMLLRYMSFFLKE
jgi:hypothetical protein